MDRPETARWARYREQSRRLAENVPTFSLLNNQLSDEAIQWVSRVSALAREIERDDIVEFIKKNRINLISFLPSKREAELEIKSALFEILEYIEERAPSGESGGFIAVGSEFDAFQIISRILSEAKSSILFVEPYADEVIVTRFAELCSAEIELRILVDPATSKGSFAAAVGAWRGQYGNTRQLKSRKTINRALHDRAVFIDRQRVWTVSQSFKDLAKRSPAVIAEVYGDVGRLKCEAYEDLWDRSTDI